MPWDETVHFGVGPQRGAGITGFHRNAGNQGVFTGLLFRGDSRPPGTVFAEGFQMHAAGVAVAGRVTSAIAGVNTDHGTTRGIVSASQDLQIGIYWAAFNALEAWVYCIYIEAEPWAASAVTNLATTPGAPAAGLQQEIMLRAIPGDRIYGARAVRRGTAGAANAMHGTNMKVNSQYAGTALTTVGGMAADPQYAAFIAGVTSLEGI